MKEGRMLMLNRLLTVILCIGSVGVGAAEAWKTEVINQLKTPQGLVEIHAVGSSGYDVRVGGHLVEELEGAYAGISNAVPSGDSPRYVLLNISTGGGSCPQLYRILDLTPGQKPFLTREFGTCGAEKSMTLQGENVAIHFSESELFKAQTFIYKPGNKEVKTE